MWVIENYNPTPGVVQGVVVVSKKGNKINGLSPELSNTGRVQRMQVVPVKVMPARR